MAEPVHEPTWTGQVRVRAPDTIVNRTEPKLEALVLRVRGRADVMSVVT